MEVQDGLIVGIYNYCDRWCERCALTSRCRLFADQAEIEFEQGNGPLTTPRVVRERRKLFEQQLEIRARLAEAQDESDDEPQKIESRLPLDLEPSPLGPDPEVLANTASLARKRKQARLSANAAVRLASETIEHFTLFVPMKMMRAFSQVSAEGPGDQQSDANGSSKAALLGLDRMEQAWATLVQTHHYTEQDVAPFLAEIARMKRNIDRATPNARAFVRPGFDEPDELKMLEAEERMH